MAVRNWVGTLPMRTKAEKAGNRCGCWSLGWQPEVSPKTGKRGKTGKTDAKQSKPAIATGKRVSGFAHNKQQQLLVQIRARFRTEGCGNKTKRLWKCSRSKLHFHCHAAFPNPVEMLAAGTSDRGMNPGDSPINKTLDGYCTSWCATCGLQRSQMGE